MLRALVPIVLLGCASGPACPASRVTARVLDEGASTSGAQAALDQSLGRVPAGPLAWYRLYDDGALDDARARVLAHYMDSGFANVRIEEPAVELAPDRGTVGITLRVQAGPRFRLGSVRVVEIDAAGARTDEALPLGVRAPEPLVREAPGLTSGEWFSRQRGADAIQQIRDRYGEQGYAMAEVTPQAELHVEEARIDLVLEIERGPAIVIDAIEILDEERGDRTRALLPGTGLSAGEPYRLSRIRAAERALASPDRDLRWMLVRASDDLADDSHRLLRFMLLRR